MILVTELCMPDIKHCPCFDMLTWNDGIDNTKIMCSSVHTSAAMQIIAICIAICSTMLIAIISEIFMSTLVKILRFRSRCKNWDLYPANSRKCECPLWSTTCDIWSLRINRTMKTILIIKFWQILCIDIPPSKQAQSQESVKIWWHWALAMQPCTVGLVIGLVYQNKLRP